MEPAGRWVVRNRDKRGWEGGQERREREREWMEELVGWAERMREWEDEEEEENRGRERKREEERGRGTEWVHRSAVLQINKASHPPQPPTHSQPPTPQEQTPICLTTMPVHWIRRFRRFTNTQPPVYTVSAFNSLALFTIAVHGSSEFSSPHGTLLPSCRSSRVFPDSSSNLPDTEFLNLEATLLPPLLITSIWASHVLQILPHDLPDSHPLIRRKRCRY